MGVVTTVVGAAFVYGTVLVAGHVRHFQAVDVGAVSNQAVCRIDGQFSGKAGVSLKLTDGVAEAFHQFAAVF